MKIKTYQFKEVTLNKKHLTLRKSGLLFGMIYRETVKTIQGEEIELSGEVGETGYVDVWGRMSNEVIRLPRNPDKSIEKYGGIEGYKASKDRALLHYISIGQFLGFCMRARADVAAKGFMGFIVN